MKLHRIEGKPEWADVPVASRNNWQKVAAATGGWITIGNILTITGLILGIFGLHAILQHHYWLGLGGLVVGRLMDIADGYAADSTGTKSPLGEAFDAVCDKLITLFTLIALFVAHLTSAWVLLAIFVPHLIISGIAAYNTSQGRRLHPSKFGKLSMALAWVGLVGLVLLRALNYRNTSLVGYAVYTCIVVSVCLALVALVGYLRPDGQEQV